MYLKRLDLQGFKSFPDKVRLEFNTGITAVVGPNGSGKSNVSDAVKWVLGEQKVKSLRGDKMEDIIFSGTAARKPLGFAEVSITLDNNDKKIPIEYTEVTVTRRIFRSGESNYLINGTSCRLKDVYEIFMDTGIGREGYSIIGQGKIDEILSTKSDDRRRLFEEAAGIVKYKARKEEAMSKLDRQRQNLVRVEDIIKELEQRIEPLYAESEKAKKYLEFKEKLKGLEINLFYIQISKIEKDLQQIDEHYKILMENIKNETTLHQNEQEKAADIKQKNQLLNKEIQAINSELMNIKTDIEKNEGNIRLIDEQIQNISKNISRLLNDIKQKELKLTELNNQQNIYESKLVSIKVAFETENNMLLEKEKEFDLISRKLITDENQIEEYKSDIIEKIRVTTDVKGNMHRTEAILGQFKNRKKQIDDEKIRIFGQIQNNETHINALKKKDSDKKEKELLIQKNIFELNNAKLDLSKNITECLKNIEEYNKKINEGNSRYKLLLELEKSYDGFFKSVKEILKLKEQHKLQWKGIHGVLGQIISVEKEFEIAVETVLGNSLQSIVTETEEDAKYAIEYLKKYKLGRATFLPLSAVKGKEIGSEKQRILKENGVLGIASEIINYNTLYKNIISSILGKVIVIDNIDNAVAFSKKYKQGYRIVTLDGDILSIGGAITGGSTIKKSASMFGRTREIKELEENIDILEEEKEKILKELEIFNARLLNIDSKLEENNNILQEIHIESAKILQEIDQTELITAEIKEQFKIYDIEEKQLFVQASQAEKSISDFKEKLFDMEKEIEDINERLLIFQDSMQQEKQKKDCLIDNITKLKINISNYNQNIKSVSENIDRILKELDLLNKEISAIKEEIKQNEKEHFEKESSIKNIKKYIDEQKDFQSLKEHELNEFNKNRYNFDNNIEQIESNIAQRLETIVNLKNDMFRIETKRERLSDEKNNICEKIWYEYSIKYEETVDFVNTKMTTLEIQKGTKELKESIKNLGSINVNSIEEYKSVNDRYNFLTIQKEDIIQANKKLKEVIDDLLQLMKTQFAEQFKLISKNFNNVFSEMFGGGKAYLKLSDKENILESGIEIIAQPPGKNLQNMMLLSGGERALTAIAILFAILKLKPSPFCILDEIEAALDDANVRRYADYLRNFSQETQFIVITHRKGTMEASDVMYGVTMQELGVSKVISVDFTDGKYIN